MTETVWLQRPSEDVPWGFRLNGGVDCEKPLTVQRVSPGSIASTGLTLDDVILKIGEHDTTALTQAQSQDIIKTSGNMLQLMISKHGGHSTPGTPQPQPSPGHQPMMVPQSPSIQQYHQQPPPMTPQTPPVHQPQMMPPQTMSPPVQQPEAPKVQQHPVPWTSGVNDLFDVMSTRSTDSPDCPDRPAVGRYFCAPVASDPASNVYTTMTPCSDPTQECNDPNQLYTYHSHGGSTVRNDDSGFESPNSSHSSQVTNNPDSMRAMNPEFCHDSVFKPYSHDANSFNPYQSSTNPIPKNPNQSDYADPNNQSHQPGYTVSGQAEEHYSTAAPPEYAMAYEQGRKPERWEEEAYQDYYKYYSSDSNTDDYKNNPSQTTSNTPNNTANNTTNNITNNIENQRNNSYNNYQPYDNYAQNTIIKPDDSYRHTPTNYTDSYNTDNNTNNEPAPNQYSPTKYTTPGPVTNDGHTWKPSQTPLAPTYTQVPAIRTTSPDNTTREVSSAEPTPSQHTEEPEQNGPPPPPAPPLPKPFDYKNSAPKAPSKFANRLEEQLSNMSTNNYQQPNYNYDTDSSYNSPPAPGAPGPYKAPGSAPGSTPTSPYSPYPAGNTTNVPQAPPMPVPGAKVPARDQQQVPDAILNMASKGSPDKKPWAYAPDMNSIQQQRERVRRRGKEPVTPESPRPAGVVPHYQQMLNMPSFEALPAQTPSAPTTPGTPGTPGTHLGTQSGEEGEVEDVLVKHAQFNSPLNLYSEQNMKDAFTMGSDGPQPQMQRQTSSSSNSSKDDKDKTMSPVYRMIHGLDDEKPRAPRMPAQSVQNNHKPSAEPREDEKTFTGLNRTEIPSKSFQRLQQYTDQNSIDTTSIRHPNPEDGDAIGDYSQASIRYMGRNIPSKSFRMLQNLTGGPDNTPIPPPQRRARKPVQPPVQESNPDDVVDIAYVGSDIPSKSFRMLQNSVGESAAPSPPPPHANMVGPTPSNTGFGAGQVSGQPSGLVQNNRGRTVKVIQLRQPPKPQAHNDTVTEF